MARQLDYTVRIHKTGASANLRALGTEMDAVAIKHKRMTAQLRAGSLATTNAAGAMNRNMAIAGRSMDKMSRSGKVLGNTLNTAFGKSNKSLSSMNRLLRDTGTQFGKVARMAKQAVFYIGAIGGVVAYKGLANYAGFQEQMNLLQTSLNPGKMTSTPEGRLLTDEITNVLKANSIETAQDLNTMTRAQNQAYSSGIWLSIRSWLGNTDIMPSEEQTKYGVKGTNVSYNEAYTQLSKVTTDAVKSIALFSSATGTNVDTMNDSITALANLMGLNKDNPVDVAYIQELYAGLLDTGLGWMEDFKTQLPKFWASSQQANATPAEALGALARLSKTNTPDMAGFITNSLFTDIALGPQKSIQKARKIGRGILSNLGLEKGEYKDERMKLRSLDIEAMNLREGSTITQKDMDTIDRFLNPQTWTDMFFDKSGTRRSVTDVIGQMGKLYSGSLGMSDAGQAMLDAAIGTDMNTRKAYAQFTGEGFEDYASITQGIDESSSKLFELGKQYKNNTITYDEWLEKAKEVSYAMSKISDTVDSFSFQWKQLGVRFSIVSMEVGHALSPAMTALNQALQVGSQNSAEFNSIITDGFAEAAINIDKMLPGMGKVVEMLGNGVKFMGTKKGKEFASSMLAGAAALLKFAGALASLAGVVTPWLSNIAKFAGSIPALTVPLTFVGIAATSVLSKALGSGLMSAVTGGAIGTALTGSIGKAGVGAAIGGSLSTWLIGGGAATIGYLIGSSIGDSIIEKVEESKAAFKNLLENASAEELASGTLGAAGTAMVDYAKKKGGLSLGDVEQLLLAGGVDPTLSARMGYGEDKISPGSVLGSGVRLLELLGVGGRRQQVGSKLLGVAQAYSEKSGVDIPESVKNDLLNFGTEKGAKLSVLTSQFLASASLQTGDKKESFLDLFNDPDLLSDPVAAEAMVKMLENLSPGIGSRYTKAGEQGGTAVNITVTNEAGKPLTASDFKVVINTGAGGTPQAPVSSMDFPSLWSYFKANTVQPLLNAAQ